MFLIFFSLCWAADECHASRGDAVGTCGKEGGGGECAWPRGGRVDGEHPWRSSEAQTRGVQGCAYVTPFFLLLLFVRSFELMIFKLFRAANSPPTLSVWVISER
jgi:hypothetical protein